MVIVCHCRQQTRSATTACSWKEASGRAGFRWCDEPRLAEDGQLLFFYRARRECMIHRIRESRRLFWDNDDEFDHQLGITCERGWR